MLVPRRLLLSAIFLLTAVSFSSAATYFVTQSGAGSRDGSSTGNAWAVSDFNKSTRPTGGDTVFFSGTITSQVVPASSGTGTGSGNVTLDFSSATIGSTGADYAIYWSKKTHLTFKNVTFGNTTPSTSGLFKCDGNTASSDITIDNAQFTGPAGGTLTGVTGGGCDNFTIKNSHIDNVSNGIDFYNGARNGITISNNYIRSSINTTDQTDVINCGDCRNVLVEGNYLENRSPGQNNNGQHNDVIQTYQGGGSSNQSPAGWTIRYNWVSLNMSTPERTGDNSWMMTEEMTDGDSGFACKIYDNVFYGGKLFPSGNNGFGCSTGTSNAHVYIYNNTMIRHNGPNGGIGGSGGAMLYFRNNAGEADPGQGGDNFNVGSGNYTPGATFNRNLFFQLAGCDSTVSGPNGSCSTDPKFMNYISDNFALASGSPLVGAGDSTIGAEFGQGIAPGATWPNPKLVTRPAGAWDVGAFQTGGNAGSPPDPPAGLVASVQ